MSVLWYWLQQEGGAGVARELVQETTTTTTTTTTMTTAKTTTQKSKYTYGPTALGFVHIGTKAKVTVTLL